MLVRSLRLHNFRNYATQELALPPGLVALTGDNGQGKTNLLEAVCTLATTKSPLVERDRELIRWGEKSARLIAEVEISSPEGSNRPLDVKRLEYGWKIEGNSIVREMRAGGVPQSAVAQWLGQLQVVAFFPHDLTLLTGEPEERRRFLNLELGKTRPAYFSDVARYRRALQQRNALLKFFLENRFGPRGISENPNSGLGTLGEWNKQIVGYGARILGERARFFRELAPILSEVHARLSGLETAFSVEYKPGLSVLKGEATNAENWTPLFLSSLEKDSSDDMRRGTTNSGPHRDDLVFLLGEMDLRRYGSQGQQRLAVLSLKLALARWVTQTTGDAPILLLDDALSELDATRRAKLLALATEFPQSVLTATDAGFLRDFSSQATVFQVEAGQTSASVGITRRP